MNNYKIKSLYIENFKLVEKAVLDFENIDLIVLDGPNGFGKTTIFDAIELIITNKINRNATIITSDMRTGFEYSPYIKNKELDIILVGEFINSTGKIFSKIIYMSHNAPTTTSNRPECFDRFKPYYYDGSIFNDLNTVNITYTDLVEQYSNKVKSIITDLKENQATEFSNGVFNFFNNFYYIEQENNTYYLKLPEKDRIKQIDTLFGTGSEKEQLKKIEEFLNKIRIEHRTLSAQIDLIKQEIEEVEREISGKIKTESISYRSLLKDCGVHKDWDREDIQVTKENKDKIDEEIQLLEHYVKFNVDYRNDNFNKTIDNYIEKKELMRNATILGYWIQNNDELYNQIVKKYNNSKIAHESLVNLQKESIITKINDAIIDKLKEILGGNHDYDAIKISLKNIVLKQKGSGELSKLIQNMNNTRMSLMRVYDEVRDKTVLTDNECPLCGYTWETYEKMIENITSKRQSLLSLLDSSTKEIEDDIDVLYNKHINLLINSINEYLKTSDNIVDDDFFIQITKTYKHKSEVAKYLKWCTDNKFDFFRFCNQKKEAYLFTDEVYKTICDEMKGLKKEISPEFIEVEKVPISKLKHIFDSCFGSKIENIAFVTLEHIKEKKMYIESVYFNALYTKKQNLVERKRKETEKFDVLNNWTKGIQKDDVRNKMPLYTICDIYSKEISKRHKKLIQDVEIPFYIFSGKILQYYQKGIGVFLDTGDDKNSAKSIRFISDIKNKHDVVHSMSSGQIAGVVIAWSLALNKVYSSQNNFNAILIDDPVQTMDDINMASLVDLLRNEFSDKQLIISTHEDYVSRYMRYKFKKSGLTEKCINVKEKLA
ncbi:AAA family ATPase [Heliobacterium gestii]|uniref:Nuclease SbcCD subunit C n=1 Tax=Heliomicrobium gestii TaxID=2699 RepID=A0A845LN87_HELGE|nr:AAA family ATPase [Heliomicrobium gestii]MBM7868126.1 exonuclease SbcC [Heliomicrobium gestii]MZP44346.1 AAA family ATPase [Heliomicrobium gestii]